jgi:hypothetical protein
MARTTCYNRFVRWRRAGIWDSILQALTRAHDAAVQMIDTSIVRVHQHAACIADSANQAVGRSRGGLTSKLHVVVDGDTLSAIAAHATHWGVMGTPFTVALVQLLLDEGGGRTRLARYISSNLRHASNDPVADLKACFPQLRDDVEKQWGSTVARLSGHQTYQLLTFAESERRLDELLQIKISDGSSNRGRPKPANLSELARRKLSPEEKTAVSHMSKELLLLVGTAHPVLRPVAREYQQIAALLIRGKRRGIAKRVSYLDGTREELAARMGDIDDYMNWFEATQMENQSGAFSDYLKASNQSQVFAPRRRDPLSVYLDALEDQIETSGLE